VASWGAPRLIEDDDGAGLQAVFDESRLCEDDFFAQAEKARGLVVYSEPTSALGVAWGVRTFRRALREARVHRPLITYDWSRGWRGFFIVPDVKVPHLHRGRGRRLAHWLTRYSRAHPDHTLDIVAMSGGCYVALQALEHLPADVSVKRCILVAGAFSPEYDLSPALERVAERMYVYYSPGDWLTVGLGTCIFGCNDGVHGFAVGNRGPLLRDHPHYREKLVVRKYTWRWLKYGYIGDHPTARSRGFLAKEVLPALHP
jgi:pimeloyl-ACP methyl ester carboxylesterase